MNQFELALAKYIQEFAPIPVADIEQHFNKSKSTISRSINKINNLIENKDFIHFDKQIINTNFSYYGYTRLLNKLTLTQYHTNSNERIRALLVEMTLNDVVNRKQFYYRFGTSDTTQKNDRQQFNATLAQLGLGYAVVARIGSRLTGSERHIRVQATKALLNTLELDKDNQLTEHISNTPINRLIASQFLEYCQQHLAPAITLFNKIENHYHLKLSYNSKKFILIYFAISLRRISINHLNVSHLEVIDFSAQELTIFENKNENRLANQVISSLTFHAGKYNCYDLMLTPLVEQFTQQLKQNIRTQIHNEQDFYADVYSVITRCLYQATLDITFPDKKLLNVANKHAYVYGLVKTHITQIEETAGIRLDDNHLATITMVIKKYVVQNKAITRERARIYLISNSSESKLGYFIEKLKTRFHVEVKGIVNSNEIIHIPDDEYDLLITFTNKISRYLSFHGKTSVKLDYQLKESDFRQLQELGLSRSARKIPADKFVNQIQGLTPHEIRHLLKIHYPEHFI